MIDSSRMAVIGAQTIDNAFGLGNGMPWPRSALKQDMARFKEITTRAPEGKKNLLITGMETFRAMGSKALPNRYMVAISRKFESTELTGDRTFCSPSISTFLSSKVNEVEDLHHIFFIGGEFVWEEGFKLSSHAYITIIHRKINDRGGLRRLKNPLIIQALNSGFKLQELKMINDNWDGPIHVEFSEYIKN